WKASDIAAKPVHAGAIAAVKAGWEKALHKALHSAEKLERQARVGEVTKAIKIALVDKESRVPAAGKFSAFDVAGAIHEVERDIIRAAALSGRRVDGRAPSEIRPISIEIGILPRAHGSALFTRGETQALVASTLGTADDEKIVD